MASLQGRNIVVFSDDWGRHPSSCQHLVTQLLPLNQVVWVNTIGMRSPKLCLYDLKRCFEIAGGWLRNTGSSPAETLPGNLRVISPVMIPYNNIPLMRSFNRLWVRRTLVRLLEGEGMTDPLVISTFPCTCDYVGDLGERVYVYYCVDDFVNWPDVDLELIGRMEGKLLHRCDLVLATAEELCKVKRTTDKPTHLLAHGVDFERFNVTREQSGMPEVMQHIRGPVIGFFGALSAWLDYELVASLAASRPKWSFVFIGPVDSDISMIANIPNIHLVGKVPYEQLPAYAAWFDAGIIPFQVNELTRSVNPLKLLEYLSLGLPVVSTYMPELTKYADVVSVVHDSDEFLAALDAAIADDDGQKRRQRIERARNNSWQAVADRFGELVLQVEREKASAENSRDGSR